MDTPPSGDVERVAGIVETDMGLGLAVEALRDREGRPAGFEPDQARNLVYA